MKKCAQNPKIALFQTFKKDNYKPPPWLKNAPFCRASVLYTLLKFQGSGMSRYWDITENNCTPCRHFYLLIIGNREIDPYMRLSHFLDPFWQLNLLADLSDLHFHLEALLWCFRFWYVSWKLCYDERKLHLVPRSLVIVSRRFWTSAQKLWLMVGDATGATREVIDTNDTQRQNQQVKL